MDGDGIKKKHQIGYKDVSPMRCLKILGFPPRVPVSGHVPFSYLLHAIDSGENFSRFSRRTFTRWTEADKTKEQFEGEICDNEEIGNWVQNLGLEIERKEKCFPRYSSRINKYLICFHY